MKNPFEKKQEDVKQEIVEAPVTQETPKLAVTLDNNKPIIIKSEIDAYINELMRSGPQDKEEIQIRDYAETQGRHRLSLPSELEKKYGQKYAFRWVNKKKDWIDRAISVRRWVIVNRVLFSDMPKYLFTANGTMENGDTILCFMPMAEAERLRKAPGEISRARVKDLPMEQWKNRGEDSPYYKPTLNQEEKDGEMLTAGIQPDVQPQE